MDLSNPWILFSSLIIGTIGVGLFIYGKKQCDLKFLLAGGGMCVFPYFVHSLLVMWLIAGAIAGGLTLASKRA